MVVVKRTGTRNFGLRGRFLATSAVVAIATLLWSGGAFAASCDTSWQDGNADWNASSSNWTAGIPTGSTNACITDGTSSVSLGGTGNTADLQLANGNILSISGSGTLDVHGSSLINAGTIAIPNGTLTVSGSSVTLTGGGTVSMSSDAFFNQSSGGQTLDNVNNTIEGTGQLGQNGLAVTNESGGTVNANVGAGALNLNGGGTVTNAGLLTATNSGTLVISNTVNNTGNITANAGTVDVGAAINGGTLNTTGGGVMQTNGPATLNGVTLSAGSTYNASAGGVTTLLQGTITNKGTIAVPNGNLTIVGATVSLTGGGTVAMSSDAFFNQNSGSQTLNNVDNTIEGTGQLGQNGMALNNESGGTVDANVGTGSLRTLSLNGGGAVTNGNLLEATGGGILQISNTVNNTGNITANGGTVDVGAAINGGTLNTTGGGVMQTDGPATLNGVTLSAGSTYNASSAGVTTLLQGTITNKGTIAVPNGNLTIVGATVTLTGGGTVAMSSNAFFNQNSGGQTLNNVDNTIEGTGQLGQNGMALNNESGGTVDANLSAAVALSLNGGGTVTNAGLLEATNSGILQISNTVNNTANITANGGTVDVSAAINGGTLNTTNGGVMQSNGNATLNGVTLSAGSTYNVPSGSTFLEGTITNNGTITLPNAGTLTIVGTTVTLTGGGTVAMSGNAFFNQNSGGQTLDNVSNTIEGTGQLGQNGMALNNESGGTVDANVGGGTLNLNGGGTVANNGTFAADSGGTLSIAAPFTNTGTVHAINGAINANAGFTGTTGTAQIDAAGTLSIGANSTVGTLAQNGTLALGTSNITVSADYLPKNFASTNAGNAFDKRSGVTGTGQILAAGPTPANMQVVTGADVTGGGTATPTLALGNVHVGDSATYQIANQGAAANPSLRGAIQTNVNGGNITPGVLTGSGVTAANFGPVSPGASSTFTVTANTAGALSGQAVHIANNFSNVPEQTLAVTGAAYALASPTVASSLTPQFNFGVVTVGQTINDPLTIKNVLVAANPAFQEGLGASFGTPSTSFLTTNGGTIGNLAPGASDNSSMVVTLHPTSTGTVSGAVPLTLTSIAVAGTGLGNTDLSKNLDYSWTFAGTVINPANPSITPTSIDFGNVRIGTTQQQALGVTNIAGAPPQASLDAQISAVGPATSNNGTITQLLAGATDNTSLIAGLDTSTAGARSGTATVALQSDSTPNGCTSDCIVDLTSQSIAVKGNVFRLATGSAASPTDLGAARVGIGALGGNLAVTNTASADGSSENLDAAITATTPDVTGSSGSVTGLAAGLTNSTGLHVVLDNSSAGLKSGTATVQFQSDGTGIDGGAPVDNGSQAVTVTGKVYTPAVATVVTASPVDFGIIHAGDFGGGESKSVTVQNGAAVTALNDVLTGSISAGGAPFSGSGNLGAGVAAQQSSSALQVNLDTNHAGIFTGAANLALASHDPDQDDLALATSPISLKAQINHFAALAFQQSGGEGSLSGGGASWALDFGDVLQGSTSPQALLSILNNNPLADQAFTDLLSSQAAILSGSGFSFTGDLVSDLLGGDSQSGFDVNFATAALGSFDEVLSFDVESSNASGYDQVIGSVTLNLEGDIVSSAPVPEPGSIPLLASGLGMLFFVIRRQRRGR